MSSTPDSLDPEIIEFIAELQETIRTVYEQATFTTRAAPDGRALLDVYADEENDFAIIELVAERTVDFMIEHHRSVHVFPRGRRA